MTRGIYRWVQGALLAFASGVAVTALFSVLISQSINPTAPLAIIATLNVSAWVAHEIAEWKGQ